MSFECNAVYSNCSLNGTSGRILIIDFRSMAAIDGGLCQPDSTSECTGLKPELPMVYSAINNGSVSQVKSICRNQCTGAVYSLSREKTGLSRSSTTKTKIIPYNDRPSIGGAGFAMRFDGIDDFIAGSVDVFPSEEFTIMLWVRCSDSERLGQGIMQYISESYGLEFALFTPENLEFTLQGSSSGPTGINVNDLQWHHIAVTWVQNQTFLSDHTLHQAQYAKLFIDCFMLLDRSNPRQSQSTYPGGNAEILCSQAVNEEGWAWSGKLDLQSKIGKTGEFSVGQRLACNSSTKDIRNRYQRSIVLNQNSTFCRSVVNDTCDPAFNSTPSAYIPGIYVPDPSCRKTASGIYMKVQQQINCTNTTDPYATRTYGAVQQIIAANRMFSNDNMLNTGNVATEYSIPEISRAEQQIRIQSFCISGCFDSSNAFLGLIDDIRIYNFSMTSRQISFRNQYSARDGLNCENVQVAQVGKSAFQGCSHMIDTSYKYGLVLYWPFDDSFSLYGTSSTSQNGLASPINNLESYDVAQVSYNKIGNFASGSKYALNMGMGFNSTAPMRVPSSAPVYGSKLDFLYYASGTTQLVELKIKDVDTCVNTFDFLNTGSDTYPTYTCSTVTECSDSPCVNFRILLYSSNLAGLCRLTCFGIVTYPRVKSECVYNLPSNIFPTQPVYICSPFPNCQGEKCFVDSKITISYSNPTVNK